MKKIIGILGVAVIAATMFFSANVMSTNDTGLASVIALNTANAEGSEAMDLDKCSSELNKTCVVVHPNGGTFISSRCEPDTWLTLADCL